MKATELMIGDYITVTPSGMLIQVAAVHKRKVAYHTCTGRLSWVREGLLRPIPVKQEILEKSGMKSYDNVVYFAKVDLTGVARHFKPNFLLFVPLAAMSVYHMMDKTMLGIMCENVEGGYYYNADKAVNIPIKTIIFFIKTNLII